MSKKILVLEFRQETNTFNPVPAEKTAFQKDCVFEGEKLFQSRMATKTAMHGAVDVFTAAGMSVIHTVFMSAPSGGKVKDDVLDELRLYEDITFTDSMGQTFYAIPDFSYVVSDGCCQTLFGEGYRICNGELRQVTCHGESLQL